MGVTGELEKAQGLLASDDISGLLRYLRAGGEELPLGEVARLVAGAARLAGFDDLAQAAAAAAGGDGAGTKDARVLYDFGYACTERGVGYLAVRPLARALDLAPGAAPVLSELVTALEQDGQHARAVAVLEEQESVMQVQWLPRFQYVYNALMAGDLEKAAGGFGRLPEPEDPAWAPAREKVRRILARAGTARAVTLLDRQDLRCWHFVPDRRCPGDPLTVRVLGDDRPLGLPQRLRRRLRGRAAAAPADPGCGRHRPGGGGAAARPLEPDPGCCGRGGTRPAGDGFRPRQARRELPCRRLRPDRDRTDAVAALRERAPGQVLFERATCWTDPPRITADVSGLLHQTVVPPWATQPRRFDDGTVGQGPEDNRPAKAVAAEIARAMPEPDEGDGGTPPDTDEGLRRFVEAVTSPGTRDGGWLSGIREYIPDAGPVPSSRFR